MQTRTPLQVERCSPVLPARHSVYQGKATYCTLVQRTNWKQCKCAVPFSKNVFTANWRKQNTECLRRPIFTVNFSVVLNQVFVWLWLMEEQQQLARIPCTAAEFPPNTLSWASARFNTKGRNDLRGSTATIPGARSIKRVKNSLQHTFETEKEETLVFLL